MLGSRSRVYLAIQMVVLAVLLSLNDIFQSAANGEEIAVVAPVQKWRDSSPL